MSLFTDSVNGQDIYSRSQNGINQTIGELDGLLSKLVLLSSQDTDFLSQINRQTLKHHAEDMIGAGQKILKNLNPSPRKAKRHATHRRPS